MTTRMKCALTQQGKSFNVVGCLAGLGVALGVLLLAGCAESTQPTPTFVVTINPLPTATLAPSPTPLPTPTPNPNAALVNGQPITIAELEAAMRHLHASTTATDQTTLDEVALREAAMEMLIERALIAQEAARLNITINENDVEEELSLLIASRGGQAAFQAWLDSIGYTLDEWREQLRAELLANAVRDHILASLERTAEYVHAYHIVVSSESEARRIAAQLQNGGSFDALAKAFSLDETTRPSGGDLGWFARGTGAIIWPEVEEVAFQLQPGETSPPVQSPAGYHIIRVTAREGRTLTEADLSARHTQALQEWMRELRRRANVQRFVQ